MIAVKALYEQGTIKFLEPAPALEQALVVVIFTDIRLEDSMQASYGDAMKGIAWGEPMDEDAAKVLVSVHEELAPYRAEAEQVYLNREEP